MKENLYSDRNEPAERAACLIAGYIRKTLTETEHDELDQWVNESDANMKLFEELTDENNIKANLQWMDNINSAAAYERLKKQGKFDLPRGKSNRVFWIAAASLLVMVAGYFLYSRFQNSHPGTVKIVKGVESAAYHTPDNGVLLTLADGTVIDLSKANNGLIEAGNVTKENDSLLNYGATTVVQNHTLKTPAGTIFQLKLCDGTMVWLNAASALQYPTAFNGNERVVHIDGEGFFEVAKDAQKPFKVIMKDSSVVTVLGTTFNVNAYNNSAKEITLVEGKVNVSKDQKEVMLSPGTGVKISQEALGKVTKADVNTVTAWKKGLFVFNDAEIKEIMLQLEQWYQIKTVYKGNISHQFNATFSRSQSLEQILKLLELNGHVHFKTENNIVYVQP